MKKIKVELTETQWRRVCYACNQQAFREAEIAINLRVENVFGPEFVEIRKQIDLQTQAHLIK